MRYDWLIYFIVYRIIREDIWMFYLILIVKLIDSFLKLLGIGIKIVICLVFYIIGMSDEDVNEFVKNLLVVKWELIYCFVCGNLIDDDFCLICIDKMCD